MKLKKITGFDYKISDTGKLFSICSNKFRKLSSKSNCGYLRIDLYKNSKVSYHSIHRLVAQAFLPNPKKYKVVNHIDGNKLNNCVNNLQWTTQSKNCEHRSRVLGKVTGETHGMAKLKLIDIKTIRNLVKAGVKKTKIAKEFNVSVRTIYNISNRETWVTY